MSQLPPINTLREQLVFLRDADLYKNYSGEKGAAEEFVETLDCLVGALDDCESNKSKKQQQIAFSLMNRIVVNLLLELIASEFTVPRRAKIALIALRKKQ